jgi:hypothetical protein
LFFSKLSLAADMKKSILLSLLAKAMPIGIICLFLGMATLTAKTIRVATQKDYFPYSYIDSLGLYSGLLIDWWELWAVKAGVDLEFIPGSTNECIDMVLKGEADAVSGLFFEDESQKGIIYSESIISLNTTLFLRRGYNPKSVYAIERPIGIIKNELSHQNIEGKYQDLKLEYFDTFSGLLEVVKKKEIAGFIYDFPYPILENRKISGIDGYYEYLVIRSDKIRPGVKEGNTQMLNLLMEGSVKISNNELLDIIDNYDLYQKPIPYEWIIPILVLLLVVITIGYLRLFRKQKRLLNTTVSLEEDGLKKIIDQGENDHVEFKSSLRWDFNQNQMNKALEMVIMKTISAFLNTNGGILIIGVDDSGGVVGLDNDYNTISKKSRDGFMLTLTNLINQHLGKNAHKFIDINIISMEGKDVCTVKVVKSDGPVFLGKNENETFFIRTSASSQRLSVSEVVGYIKSHWKNM